MSDLEQPIFVKSSEAARILGITRRTVIRWVHNGTLPGRVIAGSCLVSKTAIDRMRAEAEAA